MSNELDRDVREALATLTDEPPPAGLAAAAIRTARRQRRTQIAVTSVAVVAALAVAPAAVSAVTALGNAGTMSPAASGMGPFVITAYSGHWEGSRLLDYATGEYAKLPYRTVVPSPDGTQALVYTGENSSADPLRVGVLDVSAGEVRWMAGLHGNGNASTGAWSPDGREILVTERSGTLPGEPSGREDSTRGFAIVDAETLEITFVAHDDVADPELNVVGARYLWGPGGQEIAMTRSTGSDRDSEADLTWGIRFYDREGTLLRDLPTTGPVRTEAAFSPDGARMAIFNDYTGEPIEVVDTDTGAVLRTVSVPGWDAHQWGDLVGWADDDHLLVRSPLSDFGSYNLLVIDLAGELQQEVALLDWWEELIIGSSDGLNPDAVDLTFGGP